MLASVLVALLGIAASVMGQIPDSSRRFDLTKPSYDLWRHKHLAGVTVQQSFTFDNVNRRLFVVQRKDGSSSGSGDLTISQLDFAGKLVGSMHILGCGHGVNIGAQAEGSDTYLWTETDAASSGYGQRLWRFKFENGKTLNSATDKRKRIVPIPDLDRCTATIDPVYNNLVMRYQRDGAQNIAVFDLDEATAGNFTNPLADWPISKLGTLVDVFQGYTAYGRYIYFLTGESYAASGGTLNSQVMSLDLKTGKIVQGPVITRAGSTLEFREPEGMAIYKTVNGEVRLFLGFASGKSGDRRTNLFYKNALI